MLPYLLLLIVASVSADINSNCDANKFVVCQKKFTNSLGIDDSFNWLDPQGLSIQIQNIYIHGSTNNPKQKGLVSVCNAYNTLLQCLQDSAFTAFECFDPLFLITADASPYTAYQYSFLMNMVQYQCGAGFYPAVDNWSCLQKVYAGQNSTLTGCVRSFGINAQNDPLNSCKYVQQGMDCWSGAARSCNDAVKYYACESFRQYTTPLYSSCNQKCIVAGGLN